MIVEFIGSTGAGKTTLFRKVRSRLADNAPVAEASDLVFDRTGLPKISDPTLQNLLGDVVAFNFLIRSMRCHKVFLRFVVETLWSHSRLSFPTVNSLRHIIRTIGIHELIRRREGGRIVLVDEGTVVAAHNLFILAATVFGPEHIARFANLAPLPDMVICVKAPVDHIVRRTVERSDPPRQMRVKDLGVIERYACQASELFEQIVESAQIRNRVLVVENSAGGCDEQAVLADRICRFILEGASSGRFGPPVPCTVQHNEENHADQGA